MSKLPPIPPEQRAIRDARPDLKPELTDRLNSDQPGEHAEQRGEQANIRQNTTAKRSHMNG